MLVDLDLDFGEKTRRSVNDGTSSKTSSRPARPWVGDQRSSTSFQQAVQTTKVIKNVFYTNSTENKKKKMRAIIPMKA